MRHPNLRRLRRRRARRRLGEQAAIEASRQESFERAASAALEMAARERELSARVPSAGERLRHVNDSAAVGLLRVVLRARRLP